MKNILLLMTDQQRFDTLGCMGNDIIETPNIDWIASEGTVFDCAYTPSPSCVPARACLISGLSQWNTGILGMGEGQGPMGTGFTNTLPSTLSKFGYHTQGIGKMHFYPQRALNGFHNTILGESGRREDKDFESDYKLWFDENKTGDYDIIDHGIHWNSWQARPYHAPEFLHPTNYVTNQAIKFLKQKDPSKPFFLKVSYARPHSPYDALPYYFDLYMKKKINSPKIGKWSNIHAKEKSIRPDAWRGIRSEIELKRARCGYYGNITHIDNQIGRILMQLSQMGLLDETLILFTSDHGDMLGDHNLFRKTYAYEGSAHIPLIIRIPKSMQEGINERTRAVATLYDIFPTIIDILGLEIPSGLDGKSLFPLIKGEKSEVREYLHGEHCLCYSEEQEMQYLTDGRIKYIWFPKSNKEQIFDLESDPYERFDLSKEENYSSLLEKWRKIMVFELEKRDCGLTFKGELIPQKGKGPIISPHYEERIKNSYDFRNENKERYGIV